MKTMLGFKESLGSEVIQVQGNLEAIKVTGISYDSREVQEGTLFFCKGNAFRKEYLEQALEQGAVGYVSEKAYEVSAPAILVSDMRHVLAPAARFFYENPQEKLRFFGITGTKGKSSTAWYLRHMLDVHAKATGKKPVGFLSSITTFDGKETLASHLTTPEPFELYAILHQCVLNGIENVVMEVSSQALKYQRTEGIHFAYGAFLNISPDHISPIEHPDFADYLHSKLQLFAQSEVAVINLSTDYLQTIQSAATQCEQTLYVGYANHPVASDLIPTLEAKQLSSGKELRFQIKFGRDLFDITLPEMGRYAMENAAVATAIAMDFGVTAEEIQQALHNLHVPGRMQRLDTADGQITFIVDLAHNGISYRAIADAVREPFSNAEIIAVFGSAGGKAINRRKDIGKEANRFADYVILTMEDPNEEPVESINAQIASELTDTAFECIEDRREALARAFSIAKKNREQGKKTLILALGKGDESHMRIKGVSYPYVGDAALVRDIIREEAEKNANTFGANLDLEGH